MRKKLGGKVLFVLNLKKLNKYIDPPHFKMTNLILVKNLVFRHCFMVTVDLKDAYFTVPLDISHKKYVSFEFNRIIYQFTCMPFALCSAPFIFTKLLKPIVKNLRSAE